MDPSSSSTREGGSIGIKIYNTPTRPDPTATSSPPPPPTTAGKRRKIISTGVQKTLSKTSLLANFLPTGTLLAFETILPSINTSSSECTQVTSHMIYSLLSICVLSCFFFHFTDSFRGPDGKVYYGFVTCKGLAVFKAGTNVEVPKDDKYRVGFSDFVHALMSVLVFVAIAFSDHRVTSCLFPGKEEELSEVMQSFPLMIGIICSGLFLVFPTTRYGIGCVSA